MNFLYGTGIRGNELEASFYGTRTGWSRYMPDLAEDLEKQLGLAAPFWWNMQQGYEEAVAKLELIKA